MILVDTSIWIDHLRLPETLLSTFLEKEQVLIHPFILGELAVGNLKRRASMIQDLQDLPRVDQAYNEEVTDFITSYRLFGTGIGYVDAHLLVAAKITRGTAIWTRDKRLLAAAERLDLAWSEPKPS